MYFLVASVGKDRALGRGYLMDFRGLKMFWTRLSLIVETIPRHNEFKAASYLLERQEFTKVTMVTLVT